MITIHELSTVLSIHRAVKILWLETGIACTSKRSLERYNFERDVRILLKTRRTKEVISNMERSLSARISPISSMPLKYERTRREIAKRPVQKATPMVPMSKNFIARPRLLFEKPLFLMDEILGLSNIKISLIYRLALKFRNSIGTRNALVFVTDQIRCESSFQKPLTQSFRGQV